MLSQVEGTVDYVLQTPGPKLPLGQRTITVHEPMTSLRTALKTLWCLRLWFWLQGPEPDHGKSGQDPTFTCPQHPFTPPETPCPNYTGSWKPQQEMTQEENLQSSFLLSNGLCPDLKNRKDGQRRCQ